MRDCIVELAVILGTNISTNVYQNFGVKCMFSTTFMDPDVWLANTSIKNPHSPSVQSIIERVCIVELAVILAPIFPLMFIEISE